MKGKLVKRSNGRFDLYSIEDKNQINTIASSFDNPIGKLSLKNCQAIELGYDLDGLVENFWKEEFMKPGLIDTNSYKEGFQKALEILGDKKFSEDDILKAIEMYYEKGKIFIEIIQSLQQTEWDVEIYTLNDCQGDFEQCNKENFNCVLCTDTGLPKLDENGCLILKRL